MTVEKAAQVLMALYVWHDTYEDNDEWWWPADGADLIFEFMRELEAIPDVLDIVKTYQQEKLRNMLDG